MFYWKIKTFKTYDAMQAWVEKHKHDYQMRQIFLNNEYGIEYKDLIKINFN